MRFLAVDTETEGPDALNTRDPRTKLTIISFWYDTGKGGTIKWGSHEGTEDWERLQKDLVDPDVVKLFWNAKYDLRIFRAAGIKIAGKIIDVMLMGRIAETGEPSYTLKHFSRKFLNTTYREELRLKEWVKKRKKEKLPHSYGDAPDRILLPYALKDAQCTFELFWVMKDNTNKQLLAMEHAVLWTTMRMEDRGMMVDTDFASALAATCIKEKQKQRARLCKEVGDAKFNPNSPKQLAKMFYKDAGRDAVRTTDKGNPQVDRIALYILRDKFKDERAQWVLDWRKVDKANGTYLNHFIEESDQHQVLRGSFNQAGTRTGRFSSSGPNLQNITRPSNEPSGRLRQCFIARPGFRFVCIDYDQVELRLGACLGGVRGMLDAVRRGEDLHGVTAKRMWPGLTEGDPSWKTKRQVAKTLNFAIFYGIGSEKFMDTLIRESEMYISLHDASAFRRRYKEIYPEIEEFFFEVAKEVADTGGVLNDYGRFMAVHKYKSYVGVNYKVQSTAADLIKQKMVKCDRLLKTCKSGLVAIVHDELIFEIHHTEKLLIPVLRNAMEELDRFDVPLTCSVSIAENWGEKTAVNLRRAI